MTSSPGLIDGVPALNGAWPDADIEAALPPQPHLFGLHLSLRWLVAVLLLAAISAALIFGALCSVLGVRSHFASVPTFARRAPGEGELARGDRVAAARAPQDGKSDGAMVRSRIEQLADGETRPKSFTHVMAGLADVAAMPPHPAAAPAPVASSADVAHAALPPVIRYGAGRPAAQPHASAYAPADDGLPGTLAIPPDAINLTVIRKTAPETALRPQRRVIVARAGDTLEQILIALGTAASDAEAIATLLMPRKWFSRDAFAGGEEITVLQDGVAAAPPSPAAARGAEPVRPRFVRLVRPGRPGTAAALSDAGRYVRVADAAPALSHDGDGAAAAQPLRPSTGARLRDSLEALVQAHGIDRAVIDDVGRLCEHDVDLDAPVGADDKVELLFSPNALGQSELAFAALTLGGKTRRYYRFDAADDDSSDYYDEDGRSVTKSLLRKPVAAGRLGDGFGWRTHPVLQDRRFHEGVDYAAPMGSPIAAAASGVVEKIDEQWGYGKYIRIRHDFGYETTYAHIAGVPRGLKVGDRVRQGQTIATIGSTGLSTGPHLYYEVRINGRNVDPLRVKLRGGRVLDGDMLTAFRTTRDRTDQLLQASGTTVATP